MSSSATGSVRWTALPTSSGAGKPEIKKMVSYETMRSIRGIYQTSSLLEEIRSLLQKSVWSAGMALFREDVGKTGSGNFTRTGHRIPWTPPSHVRETLEDRWELFKHELLDSLLCYGFCVVHFSSFKEAGLSVVDERQNQYPFPTIVAPELYRLVVQTTLHGTTLSAVDCGTMEELDNTRVFADLGYNPSIDGKLTSLVSKCFVDVYHLEQLSVAAMRQRTLRCNPTVFIESQSDTPANEAQGQQLGQQQALAQTLGIAPADEPQSQNVLDGHVPLHLGGNPEQQMQADNELFRVARRSLALQRGDFEGAAMASAPKPGVNPVRRFGVGNGIPLKAGETVRPLPLPTESSNFHANQHALHEAVAGVFGVPLGVLKGSAFSSSNRGVGVANTRVVHSMYRLTVNSWRRRVSDVLTKCFGECYYELLATERLAGSGTPSKDILDEKRRRLVCVSFHPTTFVDNTDLRELYEWGVIDWETFSSYCMTNSSLPIQDREKAAPKPNPLGIGLPSVEQMAAGAGKEGSAPAKRKASTGNGKEKAAKKPKAAASSSATKSTKSTKSAKSAKSAKPGSGEPQKVIVQIQTQ